MHKGIVIFLACFLFVVDITAASRATVLNIKGEYVPTYTTGEKPTFDDIQTAILTATQARGWVPRLIEPGLIEASISVRTHRATIQITHTENTYSIIYKNSSNLNYRSGSIHKNYNNWILRLSGTIQREFGVRSQKY